MLVHICVCGMCAWGHESGTGGRRGGKTDKAYSHLLGIWPGGDGMLDKRQVSTQKGLSSASASCAKTPIAMKYLNLSIITSGMRSLKVATIETSY